MRCDARIGISLVPEDRKTEALFLKLDGRRNVSLPVIERYTRFGLIDGAREEADVVARSGPARTCELRALWTSVKAFSGGNQQKIAIAKWLFAQSRILLLFDPTRGIDVGTKHEIYALMQEYAAAGGAILFYSTEIAELDHLAHRVLVLYGGRVAADLAGGAISEDAILRATLGGAPDEPGAAMSADGSDRDQRRAAARPQPRCGSAATAGPLIAIAAFLVCLGLIKGVSGGTLGYYELSTLAARRRHPGDRGHRPDHRHPVGRLRPVRRRRDLARQRHARRATCRTTAAPASCCGRPPGSRSARWPGAFNGFFVAILRLQPIVVTLATMFILQGVTLLVMDKPGGQIPPGFGALLVRRCDPGPAADAGRCCSSSCSPLWLLAQEHACSARPSMRSARIATRPARPASTSADTSSSSMSWRARSTAWRACSSAPRPARAIRWSAIRCCCRCSPPWWSAAPCSAAGAAARSARSSAPMS